MPFRPLLVKNIRLDFLGSDDVEPCQGGDSSRMLLLLSRHDSDATDEIGEAWVRAKRIDAGKAGGEILYFASEPTGGLNPLQSRIRIAQARVENDKRNGRCTILSSKLLEFAQ